MTNVVYLNGALGDTIVAIPALRAVRDHWRDRSLLLLYNNYQGGRVTARDVLSGAGLVDEFLEYDSTRGLRESWRVLRELRSRRLHTAIYLAPGERTSRAIARDRWFFRLAGARRLAGFSSSARHRVNEAEARLERLRLSGIPIGVDVCAVPLLHPGAAETDAVGRWLQARGAGKERPLIAIVPGSQMHSKHWPIERFAELGRRLLSQFAVDLVIVGGPAEQKAGEFLRSAWGAGLNAAGCFTVGETGALLSRVDLLVTLDTGPMHMAAAVGRPCIALFSGIEAAGKWDPLGDGHVVIRKKVSCEGCRLTLCPKAGHPCMTKITVDEVWQAILAKRDEWKKEVCCI
jgi:ADP-heptose:LPS heptosyltransferase